MNNTVSCDHLDGTCRCKPGWIGATCNQKCEKGMYGHHCMQECLCDMNNTVSCDRHGGSCRCKLGWTGETCNQTCESWHFGSNCSKLCMCDIDNTWSCSHNDGICRCKPGWKGTACNETCPHGMYGDKCQEDCMCIEDKTTHCDQFNGTCYCREGWEGKYCDTAIKTGDVSRSREDSSNTGAIAGITIVVILIIAVVIVIAAFFMLRRKTLNGTRGNTGLFIYRHTMATEESAEDDDTITYANVANSVNQRQHSDQGDRTHNVYTEAYKGRPGQNAGNNRHDINYGHGYTEYAVNDRSSQEGAVDGTHEAYRRTLANEGAEYDKLAMDDSYGASMIVDPGNSLAQNPNAHISYDKVDRTGRGYIQDHDDEVNRYYNLESDTESGVDSRYSLSHSEKADEYGGVDRTGKLYRPDTETNYDKLRMN
ncbi:multiple epidermal growth factor-like domains protein 10 [Ptychodera flava]|uniref:multiple epidermal growth factor-like domains protein 10 n=1 Tax=Ptychodera flava TaxID=63121 RepID=UPI00396AAB9F